VYLPLNLNKKPLSARAGSG